MAASKITMTIGTAPDSPEAGKFVLYPKADGFYFKDENGVEQPMAGGAGVYVKLTGEAGGQYVRGGTAASETLKLSSTAHATKGKILFGAAETSAYVETTDQFGFGTNTPNVSAILDLTSTTRGFLPPRMTTAQRDAIGTPGDGLQIYNTTTVRPEMYIGGAWTSINPITAHSGLSGLTSGDPHTQYGLLAGRAGGSTYYGGTGSAESLNLYSTSHATKGPINIGLNFKEYSNGTLALGPDNTLTPSTTSSVTLRSSSSGRITFEHSSGQPWHVYPTSGNWQFTRGAADKIGFALDTSSRFYVGDGSPISIMCVSESNTGTTPGALSSTVPVLEVRNRSATVDNFSGVVFEGQGTAWDAGIFGVHEVHTSGSQTGRLELWTAEGGTREKIVTHRNTGTTFSKGVAYPFRSTTASGNITDADYYISANAAGGAVTLTLPTAVGRAGKTFVIKRTNTGPGVTIATTGGQTIDGSATEVLSAQNQSRTVYSNGANWELA